MTDPSGRPCLSGGASALVRLTLVAMLLGAIATNVGCSFEVNCTMDSHCPPGSFCGGVCRKDCEEDTDCGDGKLCTARGRCVRSDYASEMGVEPATVIFPQLPQGGNRTTELVLSNLGRQSLHLTALRLLNKQESDFTMEGPPKPPVTIAPGSALKLAIRYESQAGRPAEAILRVDSNASNADAEGALYVRVQTATVGAKLEVIPGSVEFGALPPGQHKEIALRIKSQGEVPLRLREIALSPATRSAGEFAIVERPSTVQPVPRDQSVTVKIRYSPKKLQATGKLVISSNSLRRPELEVALSGSLAAPDIHIEPRSVQFVDVPIGSDSTRRIKIENRGNRDLVLAPAAIKSGSYPGFRLSLAPGQPTTVKPGTSLELEVTYTSDSNDPQRGAVVIESNDPDTPMVEVELTSQTAVCDLQVAPVSIHFTRPGSRTVTVTNQGKRSCVLDRAVLTSASSGDFSFNGTPPSGVTIRPAGKLEIRILYSPRDAGDDRGTVVLHSSDPGKPMVVVQLSGSVPSPRECDLKIVPEELNYGTLRPGSSRALSVSLQSKGWGDCQITNLNIDPNPKGAFKLTTTLPAGGLKLSPGSTFAVGVSFSMTAEGVAAGTLEIHSNDTRRPVANIGLSGAAVLPCLRAVPALVDLGMVTNGCRSPETTVEIHNTCPQSTTITKVALGPNTNGTAKEILLKPPTLPVKLALGGTLEVTLEYGPKNLGQDLGTLRVHHSMTSLSPLVIPIRGEGTATRDRKDVFGQWRRAKLDLLLVVHTASSMYSHQVQLSRAVETLIRTADMLQVDYHIGATTTDRKLDRGCFRPTPGYITPTTPGRMSWPQKLLFGSGTAALAEGLHASLLALSEPALGGCNKGFHRKDARLAVAFLANDRDRSPQSVSFYTSTLRYLKEREPDLLTILALGLYGPATCASMGSCRYYEATRILGGKYDRIGGTTSGKTLGDWLRRTLDLRRTYSLASPADPASITVRVDGKVVQQSSTAGWSFDKAGNSVAFVQSATPPPNGVVQVNYRSTCR